MDRRITNREDDLRSRLHDRVVRPAEPRRIEDEKPKRDGDRSRPNTKAGG